MTRLATLALMLLLLAAPARAQLQDILRFNPGRFPHAMGTLP